MDLVIVEFQRGLIKVVAVKTADLPWPDQYLFSAEGLAEVFPQELLRFHALHISRLFHS